MAERIVRQLIDDIDGSDITDGKGDGIEFAVRGVTYRVDLSAANVTKFDTALTPYIESAERIDGSRRRAPKASSNGKSSSEHLAAIREWARKNRY